MRRLSAILVALILTLAATACARRTPGLFNDQNARAHIEMLAGTIGSRPVGTPANARARTYIADQLRLFGYDVRVQDADGRRASLGRTARVSNIIATKQGKRPEAIGIVSHYDSVPMGPGAGDDALGVSVALEAARVLAARSDPNWTVMAIFTDGEEAGLMGAAALTTDRDVMRQLQTYVNLESIGSAGPPMLFEAGPGNGWLTKAWAQWAPHPRGGSFIREIYRRLPNDTDFSILALHDIPGLNLAAVGDSYAYHTNRDTPERLSPLTIRQSGEQLVGIVNALDGTDITQRSSASRTFLDIGGRTAISFGSFAGTAIAILAFALGVIAWVKATATAVRLEGLARWLLTCLWIVAGGAAVIASMIGTTVALRAAHAVYHPWYAYPGRLFVLMIAVGVAVGWAVARLGQWLPPRAHGVRHPIVVWSIALLAWIAMSAAASWLVPNAAYLWLLPLLVAGALFSILPLSNAHAVRIASIVVLAVCGALWLTNTHDLLRFMVAQLGRTPIVTPAPVFTVMMALAGLMIVPPLIATISATRPLLRPSLGTALCLLAIAVASGFAYAAPAYTHEAPLRRYARAIQEGHGRTVWEVASVEPGLDLSEGAPSGWMPAGSPPQTSVPFGRLPHPFVFRAEGASATPPLTIADVSTTPLPGGSELSVTVVPRIAGLTVTFVLPAGVEPARANLAGVSQAGRWRATYIAVPADGIVFRAAFGSLQPDALKGLRVVATAAGTSTEGGWTPPAWLPNERTAWTVDAHWVVAPFDLPIAPVPPLR